jgi:acetolactate synthase
VGIGVDSGVEGCDLSFPNLEKLAHAYGYPYVSIKENAELEQGIEKTLGQNGPVICEVFVSMEQQFLPKSSAKRDAEGNLFSPPLEDMAPFLPEEEMEMLMLYPRKK